MIYRLEGLERQSQHMRKGPLLTLSLAAFSALFAPPALFPWTLPASLPCAVPFVQGEVCRSRHGFGITDSPQPGAAGAVVAALAPYANLAGGKTAEAMQEGALLTAPWWAPSKKRPPWFYGRGLRDPLTSPFLFPPAREKGPAVVFGSRSRILLPRTITESAHTSHRREVHESNC